MSEYEFAPSPEYWDIPDEYCPYEITYWLTPEEVEELENGNQRSSS